jgi:hypothetical protein
MAGPFPNEQPISTHDVIDLTETGVFGEFENDLQDTPIGQNQTKRDYEFRSAGNNGRIIIAKPVKAGNLWATEVTPGAPHQGVWVEKAQYDPATGGIDDSQSPNAQVPNMTTGACNACGIPGGLTGKFCNNCGGPITQVSANVSMSGNITPLGTLPGGTQVLGVGPGGATIGLPAGPAPVPVAGQLQPGQSPGAGAGAQTAPAHVNPNRMEGKPKKEVVVPEGMKVTKSTGFLDGLDALLAGADSDQAAEEPKP